MNNGGGYRKYNRTIWLAAAVLLIAAIEAQAQDQQRIVVSIADRTLTLFELGRVVKTWDIAVGKPSTPSPEGEMTVISRIKNPTWYSAGKIVGPGPANPVGTRWIGLSKKGYGIHGTNQPDSIGKAASHGCIRMRNRDVEELFELVGAGATVELSGL
jgi:lipoprotein-anchoring transpeptidase ErfK/SrfK